MTHRKRRQKPCAKQDTNMQPMEKTHKPRSQWKTRTCVPHHKTHMDRGARDRANSRPHTHTTRPNVERECLNPDTRPKLKTWVPGSVHRAPTRNKARRGESALAWNQDMTGVSGLCHKATNNTRPKWQNPDTFQIFCNLPGILGKFPEVSHPFATLLENEKKPACF